MLQEPTIEKLYAMRMAAMAIAWQEQHKDPKNHQLSFDERFTMLVDAEYAARDNRKLARLLKQAQLRISDACIEDVEVGAARGVDKGQLRQLATCQWIGEHLNVLVSGATGVGKTYLACALGQMACLRGIKVIYRRVPRLFHNAYKLQLKGASRRKESGSKN